MGPPATLEQKQEAILRILGHHGSLSRDWKGVTWVMIAAVKDSYASSRHRVEEEVVFGLLLSGSIEDVDGQYHLTPFGQLAADASFKRVLREEAE